MTIPKLRKLMYLDSVFKYAIHQSKGISGASAAREIGISQSTFVTYKNWRKTKMFPSDDLAQKIAHYIDWDYDDVIFAILAAKQSLRGEEGVVNKLESLINPKPFVIKPDTAHH